MDNLDVESEESKWNWLPPEMKLHCIKKMDFKTKTRLRIASKTEMRLVNSVQHSFSGVYLDLNLERSELVASTEEWVDHLSVKFKPENPGHVDTQHVFEQWETNEQFQKLLNFLKQVMRAKIDLLDLHIVPEYRSDAIQKQIAKILTQGPLLNVKRLRIPLDQQKMLGMETLKHCSPDSLTEITVSHLCADNWEFAEEFLRLPQVVSTPKLIILHGFPEEIEKIMQFCIDNWPVDGSPVGKELRIQYVYEALLNLIVGNLNTTLIRDHDTMNAKLVETSDPSKHFWIRYSESNYLIQTFLVDARSEEQPDFDSSRDEDEFEDEFDDDNENDYYGDYYEDQDDDYDVYGFPSDSD